MMESRQWNIWSGARRFIEYPLDSIPYRLQVESIGVRSILNAAGSRYRLSSFCRDGSRLRKSQISYQVLLLVRSLQVQSWLHLTRFNRVQFSNGYHNNRTGVYRVSLAIKRNWLRVGSIPAMKNGIPCESYTGSIPVAASSLTEK